MSACLFPAQKLHSRHAIIRKNHSDGLMRFVVDAVIPDIRYPEILDQRFGRIERLQDVRLDRNGIGERGAGDGGDGWTHEVHNVGLGMAEKFAADAVGAGVAHVELHLQRRVDLPARGPLKELDDAARLGEHFVQNRTQ